MTTGPSRGATIVVRYRILGPWTMRLRQTVVEHEPGVFIQFLEEGLAGLWIDRPRFEFELNLDGSVTVILIVSPTSRFRLAKPLIWLVSLPFTRLTPKAMATFATLIERHDEPGD